MWLLDYFPPSSASSSSPLPPCQETRAAIRDCFHFVGDEFASARRLGARPPAGTANGSGRGGTGAKQPPKSSRLSGFWSATRPPPPAEWPGRSARRLPLLPVSAGSAPRLEPGLGLESTPGLPRCPPSEGAPFPPPAPCEPWLRGGSPQRVRSDSVLFRRGEGARAVSCERDWGRLWSRPLRRSRWQALGKRGVSVISSTRRHLFSS